MIEIAALATTLVGSILGPFLKQGATELGKKLQERATDQATDAAASGMVSTAKLLWDKVRSKVAGTDKEPVVDLFATQPDSMASSMLDAVEQLMQADPAFHKEISDLVEGEDGDGLEKWHLIGETVGVFRAREVSGGVNAGVMINNGPPTATAGPSTNPPSNRGA